MLLVFERVQDSPIQATRREIVPEAGINWLRIVSVQPSIQLRELIPIQSCNSALNLLNRVQFRRCLP